MYREWAAGRATIRPKTNMYVYDDDGEHRYGFSTMEGGSQELGVVAIRIKSDVQPIQRELPPPGTSLPTSAPGKTRRRCVSWAQWMAAHPCPDDVRGAPHQTHQGLQP